VNGCNDGKVIADAIRTILTNPNNKRIVITGKPDTGKTLLFPQNPRRVLDLDVSQIRNRQKNQKKNMSTCTHMQTKFFLWEGLVELLL